MIVILPGLFLANRRATDGICCLPNPNYRSCGMRTFLSKLHRRGCALPHLSACELIGCSSVSRMQRLCFGPGSVLPPNPPPELCKGSFHGGRCRCQREAGVPDEPDHQYSPPAACFNSADAAYLQSAIGCAPSLLCNARLPANQCWQPPLLPDRTSPIVRPMERGLCHL